MATVDITGLFLNKDKREHESVVVTLPALLQANGGRTNPNPTYVQYDDVMTASVVAKETLVTRIYLIVEEAFPTGTTATISVAGSAAFTTANVSAVGVTVSSVVDVWKATGGDITVELEKAATTGDVTTGKLRVVVDTIPYTVKNGRYSVKV